MFEALAVGAEVEEWAEAKLRGMVVAALLHEVSVGGMVILSGKRGPKGVEAGLDDGAEDLEMD